jgi:RNA polymerase sigma factor FliA
VPDQVENLWSDFQEHNNLAAREKLVKIYEYLVRYVAKGFSVKNSVLESGDLYSFGLLGLLDAVNRFDRSKNVSFNSYAIHRIRGAILDGLRGVDWAPRSIQDLTKKSMSAIAELEHLLKRPPTEREIADFMHISLDDYRKFLNTINDRKVVSLQDLLELNDYAGIRDRSNEENKWTVAQLTREELVSVLRDAIYNLPSKEKLVITLYFYEGLNLNDIASVLSVSESRVSQMRSQALLRLREALSTEVLETI